MNLKRNQHVQSLRRVPLFVYDVDGAPADPTTSFTGTNELLVDKGDGQYVAPDGTLANASMPWVIADDDIEAVDTGAGVETLTLTAHGLLTGDGPIRFTTTGGLPGGLAVATDYWVIRVDANKIAVASSLANALAGTRIDLTSSGTGTNTLVDTASTRRLVSGEWVYTASQAELNYRGTYFAVRISKSGFRDVVMPVELEEAPDLYQGTLASATSSTAVFDGTGSSTNDFYNDLVIVIVGGTGIGQARTIADYVGATKTCTVDRDWVTTPDGTSEFVVFASSGPAAVDAATVWDAVCEGSYSYGDIQRAQIALLGCKVSDYTTNTFVFKSINGAKTRWTVTADDTGRLTATPGDLT